MENINNNKKTIMYTVEEIAEILGIAKRSAYNLCANTKDFKVKKIGRLVRVQKDSFDEWCYK